MPDTVFDIALSSVSFEEFFVSEFAANSDVAVSSAEVEDFVELRIVAGRILFFEAYSSSLYADFKHSIICEELVETKLLPSVFFEDIPLLNNIYQVYFTLNCVAA